MAGREPGGREPGARRRASKYSAMNLSHLDDDALSDAVDGLATEAARQHLAACGPCRKRLEALRTVARAVSTPVVPAPPEGVDAALRSAPVGAGFLAAAAVIVVVLGAAGLVAGLRRSGSTAHSSSASVAASRPAP